MSEVNPELENKLNFISASSKVNFGDDEEILEETKRLIDKYKRKIDPEDIKNIPILY